MATPISTATAKRASAIFREECFGFAVGSTGAGRLEVLLSGPLSSGTVGATYGGVSGALGHWWFSGSLCSAQ